MAIINISGDTKDTNNNLLRSIDYTNTPLYLTLGLKEEYINDNYKYYLYTIKDNELTKLTYESNMNNRISFYSSNFGTYIIAYKDNTVIDKPTPEIITPPAIEEEPIDNTIPSIGGIPDEIVNEVIDIPSCPFGYVYLNDTSTCKYIVTNTSTR